MNRHYLSDQMYKYLTTEVPIDSIFFSFLVLFFVLFLLWFFYGGGDYEYIGLAPLKLGVDSTKYNLSYHNNNTNFESKFKGKDFELSTYEPEDLESELGDSPVCKQKKCSKGEQKCRDVMEQLYGAEFPCVRPDFLKNPETKRNLELDCYNSDLQIAVEYNGIQHYKWPNFTGQTKEEFIKQIRRDEYKVRACDANNVYLITVPYTIPISKIESYILDYLPEV